MVSNSRLSAKPRTIDIAVKITPISRLSATDTCRSSIGNSVICVSTGEQEADKDVRNQFRQKRHRAGLPLPLNDYDLQGRSSSSS